MPVESFEKRRNKSNKLPIYLDLDTLESYCEYLLNYKNSAITYSNLSNLYEYVKQIGDETFRNSDAKYIRYLFILKFLEGRLDRGLVSPLTIFQYIRNHVNEKHWKMIDEEVIHNLQHNVMSKTDVEFLNETTFNQLSVIFMHAYKDKLMKIIEDLNMNEFGKTAEDCDSAIELFQGILEKLNKAKRKAVKNTSFNLSDKEEFDLIMNEAAKRAVSKSHFLSTGWQGVNRLLGGGFEDSRLYNFIGATGGFKSGLLLNIMKSIKKYNKSKPHKDPSKRATILFISQENNIWETFSRIYGIFSDEDSFNEKTPQDIIDAMQKGGFTCVEDEFDIDIEFRYYGNQEIGVNDISGMIQELNNTGRECICIIQDYIERLRPPRMGNNTTKREQLADVSNQLHDLAIELDIPIITASQINRDGVAMLEEAQEKGNVDAGKKITSGNISESYAMLKNFDVNIIIVVEYDSKEHKYYLAFKTLKFRGDDRNVPKYIIHPFAGKDSKIKLVDDFGGGCMSRGSMLEISREEANRSAEQHIVTGDVFTFNGKQGQTQYLDAINDAGGKVKMDIDPSRGPYSDKMLDPEADDRDGVGFSFSPHVKRDSRGFIDLGIKEHLARLRAKQKQESRKNMLHADEGVSA